MVAPNLIDSLARYTAIDVSRSAVEKAAQLATEAGVAMDVRVADLFALPDDLRELDLIVGNTIAPVPAPVNGRDDDVSGSGVALHGVPDGLDRFPGKIAKIVQSRPVVRGRPLQIDAARGARQREDEHPLVVRYEALDMSLPVGIFQR